MTEVKTLEGTADDVAILADLLVEAVASGGGVSFMHPLPIERARKFWWDAFEHAGRGHRIIFGSYEADVLVGTVTLHLDLPENQPHRAEIMKMIVAGKARRRGHATALLSVAEAAARSHGRTLLVLDNRHPERRFPALRAQWLDPGRRDSGLCPVARRAALADDRVL